MDSAVGSSGMRLGIGNAVDESAAANASANLGVSYELTSARVDSWQTEGVCAGTGDWS